MFPLLSIPIHQSVLFNIGLPQLLLDLRPQVTDPFYSPTSVFPFKNFPSNTSSVSITIRRIHTGCYIGTPLPDSILSQSQLPPQPLLTCPFSTLTFRMDTPVTLVILGTAPFVTSLSANKSRSRSYFPSYWDLKHQLTVFRYTVHHI